MNKVIIAGRIVEDPVVKQTTGGHNFCQLTLAVDDSKKNTSFIPCVAWNQQATFLGTYVKKGDLVGVDGHLDRRSYVSKEGKTVYIMEVKVDAVKVLAWKRKASEGADTVNIDSLFKNKVNGHSTAVELPKPAPKFEESNEDLDWIEEK